MKYPYWVSRTTALVLPITALATMGGCGPQPLGQGNPLPLLQVDGWTNGPAPTPEALANQVIVLEVFATW